MLQYSKLIAGFLAVSLLAAIVWPRCSAKAEAPRESDQGLIFHSEL